MEIVSPHLGIQRLQGTVVDVSGEGIVLELKDHFPRKIPPEQLIRIETRYSEKFWDAQGAVEAGRLDEAIQLLLNARGEEKRLWVRGEITAYIIRLLQAKERYAEAAREFLASDFAGDTRSPYWSCVPLIWFQEMAVSSLSQDATGWVVSNRPEQQLLGASYLLGGPRQSQAVATLERLRVSSDRVVALLAAAQLWRREIQTADGRKISGWEKAVDDLPGGLRAGPCYVIAEAWRAQRETERALIAYLKPPILWPENRRIAARCLWEAANLLEKGQGQSAARADSNIQKLQASTLYQELAKRYPESPWVGQGIEIK
ncbi:MAG: tetratricopeptide repeat protein [Thermogutta sp.]